MTKVVIASAAPTAIGSYGKSLAHVPSSGFGAPPSRTVLERAGAAPSDVDHVVSGTVIHGVTLLLEWA